MKGKSDTTHTDRLQLARKRVASAASDSKLPRDIIDCLPDLCFVVLRDGTILDANRRAENLLGRKRKELIRQHFNSLMRKEHGEWFGNALRMCCAGEEIGTREVQLLVDGGSMIDVSLFLSRFPADSTSSAAKCIVTARDISEEKKRELDLLQFSNVAHLTVNPIEITDVNGNITYINPAFERASGYTRAELIGKNPRVFGSGKHPKEFWKPMWDTIKAGKVWVGEIENRRRNGEPFYTFLLISPIIDNDGNAAGYFGVHRDITEQRYLQQQLIQAQKMESIGTLAAGIAHEVGNPLTSISALVQVIQRTTQDESAKEKLELIRNQVSRISRIIRDLVDFSRPSKYEMELTDVNRRVRDAVEIVKVGKRAREISFRLDLDENVPALPLVPDQIEQVFINMLINALDALQDTPRSGGDKEAERRGEVVVRTYKDQRHLFVVIQDNGKGISELDMVKVFEPFFTTKNVGEGTGLGLWVSYGIVESFGGDIRVKSKIGQGTTFTIMLPLNREH